MNLENAPMREEQLPEQKKYQDHDWMKAEYEGKKRSCWSLAYECGVSCMTISRWLKRLGIPARDRIFAVKQWRLP